MLPPPYHIYFRFGIPLKYMSNTNIFLTLLESLFLSRALLERLPLTGVTKESATATHKKCGKARKSYFVWWLLSLLQISPHLFETIVN